MIAPRQITPSTRRLLNMVITSFTTSGGESQKEVVGTLHQDVRAVLVPSEGTITDIIDNPDNVTIAPIHLENASVGSILDYIVTRGPGAAWILTNIGSQWFSHPNEMPYQVEGFGNKEAAQMRDFCEELK